MSRKLFRPPHSPLIPVLVIFPFFSIPLLGQHLSPPEAALVRSADEDASASVALLEKVVNINSGTFNSAGVVAVGKVFEHEFQALGFSVRWLPMDAVGRAPSLVAEQRGDHGKRVLLIGHMDTVFESSSPFQKFVRNGDTAVGPGTADMKGGIVVIVSALKALHSVGRLEHRNITVFLTGDEESAGEPVEISRKDLIAAARTSDAVLSFEPEISQQGKQFATTARRGGTFWDLRVQAKSGHSSQIFSPAMGDGAIFELSRILTLFHDTLRESNLTYNVGLVVGGAAVKLDPNGEASVSGKVNIVPDQARATGDIRALFPEQLAQVKQKMQAITTRSLPGTTSEIRFVDKYPPMAPTVGNAALLAKLNEVNRALGAPEQEALNPMARGAGDASFAAPFTDVLDGLGAPGSGAHAAGENVDLSRLPLQVKRAALLIYRLTE